MTKLEPIQRTPEGSAIHGLPVAAEFQLVCPLHQLVGEAISPREAFVLSRLAEHPATVSDLSAMCQMPIQDVQALIAKHLQSGNVVIL